VVAFGLLKVHKQKSPAVAKQSYTVPPIFKGMHPISSQKTIF